MIVQSGKQLVWLVTGASTGLGLALTRRILARGDYAIATARTSSKLANAFSDTDKDRLHMLPLDVNASPNEIRQAMDTAVSKWGRIDCLVNNAGHSDQLGPGEEIGVHTLGSVMRTNLDGAVNCTNAVLPHMRARKEGTVLFIGSRTAFRSEVPGFSAYAASKAAVHAYGEALSAEVSPMNIRVSIVVPGTFQTAFNSPRVVAPQIPDYKFFHDAFPATLHKMSKNPLASDPEKGMEVIVDVVRGEGRAIGREGWPLWLVLGNDALADVRGKTERIQKTMDSWGDLGKDLGVNSEGA